MTTTYRVYGSFDKHLPWRDRLAAVLAHYQEVHGRTPRELLVHADHLGETGEQTVPVRSEPGITRGLVYVEDGA